MEHFFELLRYSLGITDSFETNLSPEEWKNVFEAAHHQSIVGVLFCGVSQLKGEFAPPLNIAMQWTAEAEKIIGMNKAFNVRAKELTEFFAQHNHLTAILKGQANARLYPNPLSRQPGDIDIYVEGGKEKVLQMLYNLNLIKKGSYVAYHHVELAPQCDGITVEVHFRPSSGIHNIFGNKQIQKFLNNDIKNVELTNQGFNIPSVQFALVMQMAHILRHLFGAGVGLRQITDYYYLLKSSSTDDRQQISSLLDKFKLKSFAAALMWVLQHIFVMDNSLMLCPPNQQSGQIILEEISRNGNFGWYSDYFNDNFVKRQLKYRKKVFKLFKHFPKDIFWARLENYTFFFKTIPLRIRHRSISLKDVDL
ncbi:MAG: nucleotidyltransferase family protein [Bacteroidales bacterium]|nr:nucleotidyltransferase family protein [Bacteroidales bacterium]